MNSARALYGVVPTTLAVMQAGTTAAEAYLGLAELDAQSTLGTLEREYLAIRVATLNRCEYCLVGHCARALALGADPAAVSAAQVGGGIAAREDALLHLASAIVARRGALTTDEFFEARASGLDDTAMLDVVVVVVENTLGNLVNNLAQTPAEHALLMFLQRRGVSLEPVLGAGQVGHADPLLSVNSQLENLGGQVP